MDKWKIDSKKAKWASQHDWFRGKEGSEVSGFCIKCLDYEDNDPNKPIIVRFTDFHELLRWAGY